MFKRAPKPEGLSDLFEKNTIRKRQSDSSTGSPKPISLSLPEPIEGAPAVKPYRRPLEPPSSPRAALLPFRLPEVAPERPEPQASAPAPAPPRPAPKPEAEKAPSSHAVAQLNRLYALKDAHDKPPAEPARPAKTANPESEGRLRRTEAQLELARHLLELSQDLESRLKASARLICERFSLWRVRIWIPESGYPLSQVIRVQHLGKTQHKLPESEHLLRQVLRSGQEQRRQESQATVWMLPLKQRQSVLGVVEILHSPAIQLSADESLNLHALINDLADYLQQEQLAARQAAATDRDPLTGLFNHSSFQVQLDTLFRESKPFPLQVLRLDLDYFSQINEVHGHLLGDSVLQQLSTLIHGLLPEQSISARLGGAEFAVLLPQLQSAKAQELADQLRSAVAGLKLNGKFEAGLGVTLSIGLAHAESARASSPQTLLEQAQEALIRAKERGRNQVQLYRERPPESVRDNRPAPTAATRPAPVTRPDPAPVSRSTPTPAPVEVQARRWSEILKAEQAEIEAAWQEQTADYAVPEVSAAVAQLSGRLSRLLDAFSSLLERKTPLEELTKMPISYFMPSPVVAEIRRGHPQHQLISYEVAFMLLQESLQAVLGERGEALQPALEAFFLCINEKLTALKSDLQKGR